MNGTLSVLTVAYKVCALYKGSVTSWIRTVKHNASLPGSVPNSKHLTGEAIDVVYDGPAPRLDMLQMLATPFGVKVVREANHDHFQVI